METEIFKEVIKTIKENKRPELIEAPIYGRYTAKNQTFLYSDSKHIYERLFSYPDNKTVRSVKAFAEIIKEELRRRENESGDKATVKVSLEGGYFIPDDDYGREKIEFKRLNSQQWDIVKNGINRTYNHKTFLLFLQSLSPSIVNFNEVFKYFSLLRIVGNSTLTSNPIITESGQTQGYICTYKLDNGCDGEEYFPTGFSADVPFAKAGEKTYNIPFNLLFTRNDDNELRIEVLCPLFENIEENAIIDEANFIKSETEQFEKLLVLSDF